jgi:hypothetical protein
MDHDDHPSCVCAAGLAHIGDRNLLLFVGESGGEHRLIPRDAAQHLERVHVGYRHLDRVLDWTDRLFHQVRRAPAKAASLFPAARVNFGLLRTGGSGTK